MMQQSMSENKYLIEGPIPYSMIGEVMADIVDSAAGAISVFVGRVRADVVNGRAVQAIEYSSYILMLEEAVEAIKAEAKILFPDVRAVAIFHSKGIVSAGQISLLVVVVAGHREQAMLACPHVVEMIKKRLPLWKREIFSDNSYRWI